MYPLSSEAVTNCPIPVGEVLADKYRIERVLGEGGMGVVVLAHHLELDQPVAIKFLLEGVSEQAEGAERFRREARAAAKIHSDHVVRVLDVGVMHDGIRYMVMEYLEGRDLSEALAEQGCFPLGVACGFILEAIDAVGQAHAVGIVHRDLKPANLFLAKRPDGQRRIKVLDFGISKTVGAATTDQMSLTKTSAWIGSPLYMAPEQMQSAKDVDARADVWSLGAILYELIVGAPPYEAESLPQLCSLLITTDPPPIQSRRPEVPDDLAHAIMSCLTRDPAKRTQSVSEMAKAIARYATTITGGGYSRASLMEMPFSQLGPSVLAAAGEGQSMPASLLPHGVAAGGSGLSSAYAQTAMAGAHTPSAESGTSGLSGTRAAWGATDRGQKRSGGLFAVGALVLSALVGAAFFWFGGSSYGEGDPKDPFIANQADSAESSADQTAKTAAAAPLEIKEDLASSEAEKVEPDSKKVDKETAETQTSKATQVEVARPSPSRSPSPVVKNSGKSTSPTPAPVPTAPKDDFADFGGRR